MLVLILTHLVLVHIVVPASLFLMIGNSYRFVQRRSASIPLAAGAARLVETKGQDPSEPLVGLMILHV